MFGYVTPDKPYMLMKDYALYRCVYCGICKSLQENYGTMPRFTTSYDSVFLSLLLHNYLNIDYTIKKQNCILHPLKKRNVVLNDEISKQVVTVNILLAFHKFTDDIIDGEGFKKRFLRFLIVKKAYKKAKKIMPEIDSIIKEEYSRLRAFEKAGEKSIDKVSDCFAKMMERICKGMLKDKSTQELERIFYNIGKWIYLIDAVDDLEKDKKSGCYNPLIAAYGSFEEVNVFKEKIKGNLSFTFNCIYNVIEQDLNATYFYFNTDVIRNIMISGLKSRTNMLLENNSCTKIRI